MRAAAVQVQRADAQLLKQINTAFSLCFNLFKSRPDSRPPLGGFEEGDFKGEVLPGFIAHLNEQADLFVRHLEAVRQKFVEGAFHWHAEHDDALKDCRNCLDELELIKTSGTYTHKLTVKSLEQRYLSFERQVRYIPLADFQQQLKLTIDGALFSNAQDVKKHEEFTAASIQRLIVRYVSFDSIQKEEFGEIYVCQISFL